jgi:TPP-dependent indolepyruvate ferredoxin oxidoreductase alpha subunit
MSKDAQKDRGRMRKTKLVNIKGGKCEKCGYDRNYAALSFHHRDSSLKKFTLDDLLCMNCHFSLHNPTQKFE